MLEEPTELEELVNLLKVYEQKVKETALEDYEPYDFQKTFHNSVDPAGDKAHQKFLQAANQVGKTLCAGKEFAWHATGHYPDWYTGVRIENPKLAQVSGVTNETTRDICQAELLGDPEDPEALGTGSIPKDCILETHRKPGIQNAFDSVIIKHKDGNRVTVKFRAYEAGYKKFMGHSNDFVWCDEEPPPEIWSQLNRSQIARPDCVLLATFTPEEGNTALVQQINESLEKGQSFTTASWNDAPHIAGIEGRKEYLLSKFPAHERDMRSRGIPMVGVGLIFPFTKEQIMCEPFPIPDHWPRINGLDFGWVHPFACVFTAYDENTDTIYMYDEYTAIQTSTPVIASAIKKRGDWIPCIWPHDGMSADDKEKNKSKKSLLEDEGVKMHDTWFTNPPAEGEQEGKGGNSVETGLMNMYNRFDQGRLKIFSNCEEVFTEMTQYHRKMKNGKSEIVKLNDDVISALRYAVQSTRHAVTEIIHIPEQRIRVGARNW